MSDYSKYKDRSPQDTVFEVQRILNEAGLFTTLRWVENEYSGVYSNRITLYPSDLGTNGKGTDRLYASASAYAELMERIQNYILMFSMPLTDRTGEGGFVAQPDEKMMSIDEVIAQQDPFIGNLADQLNLFTHDSLKSFLAACAGDMEHPSDGTILTVPYADLSSGRVIWVPRALMTEIYGSNGMAAGNTLEEALVQGLSEVFERYVNGKLLRGECVPPLIPDEALKPYGIWDLIEQIRSGGKYSVTVFDCSLGMGLPVIATAITDTERGYFSMKLGAHPSFAVAVERTLTESFQGWEKLEIATSLCTVGSDSSAADFHNIPNVIKIGSGFYPAKLFCGEPDWEFQSWPEREGMDNRDFLKMLMDLLKKMGRPVLVRDVSHLGFPSVSIVVPGFSEMYPINITKIRSANTIYRNADAIGRFPFLTPEEENRLLMTIRFKERSFIENTFRYLVLLPLSGERMSTERVAAFLLLKKGDYAEAGRYFSKLRDVPGSTEDDIYLNCMIQYCRYRSIGMDAEAAFRVLHRMFREDAACRVEYEVKDPDTMMGKVFPHLNCPDCGGCALAGKECHMPEEKEVLRKIRSALSRSSVSQQVLLDKLKEYTDA